VGGTYANVSARTTDLDLVREVLASTGRNARVVVEGDWVVVCDEQSDLYYAPLEPLELALAARVEGPTVRVESFDGDTLSLVVRVRGDVVAWYELAPGYPEEDLPPAGDPEAFAAALAPDADLDALRAAMFPGEDEEYLFAVERHVLIAERLRLPGASAGSTWSYLDEGDTPYVEIVTVTGLPEPPMQTFSRLLSAPGAFVTGDDGVMRPNPEVEQELLRLVLPPEGPGGPAA
jgi:hypothetical protein